MWFPRVRVFELVSFERVGDEVVVLVKDGGRIEYHTCAGGAFEVWQYADGTRSVKDLADLVYGSHAAGSITLVELALDELRVAGLLEGADEFSPPVFNRRSATKLALAGLIGGVGLPMVRSITAPNSASADTCLPDPEWTNPHACGRGDSCRCWDGCCCEMSAIQGVCATAAACGPERACI